MIRFKPDIPVINRGHPQARNLLAAWPHFEGGGDSKTLDIGPRRFHGTFQGSPSWSVDKYGRALTYNGSDAWLDMGDVLNMGTDSFTAIVLVKADSGLATDTSGARIIEKRGTGGTPGNAGWQFVVRQQSSDVTISNSVYEDGSSTVHMNNDEILGPVEEWLALAWRVDKDADLLKIYAGGDEKKSQDISSVTGSVSNARSFIIGSSGSSQFFPGEIADARMYRGALPVNMIQEIAADPFALYRPPTFHIDFAQFVAPTPMGEVSVTGRIDALADLNAVATQNFNRVGSIGIRVEIEGDITKDFRNVQTFAGAMGIVAELDGVVSAQFTQEREGRIDIVAEFSSPVTFQKMKTGQIDAVVNLVAEKSEGDTPVTDQDIGEAIVFRVPKIDYVFRARKHPTGRTL